MRITEALIIITAEKMPLKKEFKTKYTHINYEEAKELRRKKNGK